MFRKKYFISKDTSVVTSESGDTQKLIILFINGHCYLKFLFSETKTTSASCYLPSLISTASFNFLKSKLFYSELLYCYSYIFYFNPKF